MQVYIHLVGTYCLSKATVSTIIACANRSLQPGTMHALQGKGLGL